MISATDLRLTFGKGTPLENPALRGMSLTVNQGEFVTVIGSNGAGKTALAQLLTDQLRPQKGQIVRHESLNDMRHIVHLSFELQRQLMEHDKRFDDSEVRKDAFDVGTTVKHAILKKQTETERFMPLARQCGIRR